MGFNKKVLELRIVPTKDKYDATTTYMMRERGNGEAFILSKKMSVYRDTVLNVMKLPWNSNKNWIDYEYRRVYLSQC